MAKLVQTDDADFEHEARTKWGGRIWREFRRRFNELLSKGWPGASAEIQARKEMKERIAELKARDLKKQLAAEEAAGLDAPADPDEDPAAESRTSAKARFLDDVHWVYDNIGVAKRQRTPPPSMGAKWLMEQAEADPKVLREPLMMMAKKADLDKSEQAIRDDCRRSYEEIRKVLDRIGGVR